MEDETDGLLIKHTSYTQPQGEGVQEPDAADGGAVDGGRRTKGLSMWLGAVFLLGEMAGAGILSLPKAMVNTGWWGLGLMVVLCVGVGYSGTRLALCWVLLEERYPEYRVPCRRPYPAIAYRALGKPGQYVTEIALTLTLFGASTVYLLLASQQLHGLILPLLATPCQWSILITGVLTPFTWLGTPKDFWPASVLAMGSTVFACVVVCVQVAVDSPYTPAPSYPTPTATTAFLGMGAMLFSLGGASIFPTVQNDMRDRRQFPDSVVVAFHGLLILYLPIMCICYGVLGGAVHDNVLTNLRPGVAVTLVNALIAMHFLFALVIIVNPLMQSAEGWCGVREGFGIGRYLVRTVVFALVLLAGLAVPQFGKILDLVGGSTVTLMSFVLPPLCYLRLCDQPLAHGLPHKYVGQVERVVLYGIVVVGLCGGAAATYSALGEILAPKAFSQTCFSKDIFFR